MSLRGHRFLGLPAVKPRVWIDLSSAESKRVGLSMHSPGRKMLRFAVRILGRFAWLPIDKIVRGPIKRFDELDGHEVIERAVGESIEYLTLYMGNDSAKSKLTVLVSTVDREKHGHRGCLIVKLGKTPEAANAIRNEVSILTRLMATPLCAQVPQICGDVRADGSWTWSAQSVLPKGKSPAHLQSEHFAFLEELRKVNVSHGDFAPWNCSIVDGKLYVWDWEDAGPWFEGKDESWFKSQVKKLLGIDA